MKSIARTQPVAKMAVDGEHRHRNGRRAATFSRIAARHVRPRAERSFPKQHASLTLADRRLDDAAIRDPIERQVSP